MDTEGLAAILPDDCPICMLPMSAYVTEEDEIASLPCQHKYHNSCISAWTNTATSCPYCRKEFTSINVLHELNGLTIRTYTVEPKTNATEVEESDLEDDYEAFIHDIDPPLSPVSSGNCQACGGSAQDENLLPCNSCYTCYHHSCLETGLDRPPTGYYFVCQECLISKPELSERVHQSSIARRSSTRRRPAASRSRRRRLEHNEPHDTWRQAWQEVAAITWHRLNAELQYIDEPEQGLTAAQRADVQIWRNRVERRPYPIIQSSEEVHTVPDQHTAKLWAAFEQAKSISNATNTGTSRQRPHSSEEAGSSVGLLPQTTGDLSPRQKRPKSSKRLADTDESLGDHKHSKLSRTRAASLNMPPETGFLSSLLQTIKEPRREEPAISLYRSAYPLSIASSRQHSPVLSPGGASSALPVDSHSPLSPQSPQSSYTDFVDSPTLETAELTESDQHVRYTKTDLSKVVTAQLKPLYKTKLNKDEFTEINKTVTRRLFEERLDHATSASDLQKRISREIATEMHTTVE